MELDISIPTGLQGFVGVVAATLEFGRQRLQNTLQGLSPEQLSYVPPGLQNSIATLVVHICGAEINIGHRITGESLPDALKAEFLLDRPSATLSVATGERLETLTAKMQKSRAILLDLLTRLTDDDLDREVAVFSGRRATVRWLLCMLPNHQTQHVGQIILIKKLLPVAEST